MVVLIIVTLAFEAVPWRTLICQTQETGSSHHISCVAVNLHHVATCGMTKYLIAPWYFGLSFHSLPPTKTKYIEAAALSVATAEESIKHFSCVALPHQSERHDCYSLFAKDLNSTPCPGSHPSIKASLQSPSLPLSSPPALLSTLSAPPLTCNKTGPLLKP